MLIAEELFLLLRRDDGKPESAMAHRGYGFAAALLTDLVVAGRITLSDDKDPRMSVLRAGPVGHPALDAGECRVRSGDHEVDAGCQGRLAAVMEQVQNQLLGEGERA